MLKPRRLRSSWKSTVAFSRYIRLQLVNSNRHTVELKHLIELFIHVRVEVQLVLEAAAPAADDAQDEGKPSPAWSRGCSSMMRRTSLAAFSVTVIAMDQSFFLSGNGSVGNQSPPHQRRRIPLSDRQPSQLEPASVSTDNP